MIIFIDSYKFTTMFINSIDICVIAYYNEYIKDVNNFVNKNIIRGGGKAMLTLFMIWAIGHSSYNYYNAYTGGYHPYI